MIKGLSKVSPVYREEEVLIDPGKLLGVGMKGKESSRMTPRWRAPS